MLAGGAEMFADRVITLPVARGPEAFRAAPRPARVHPGRHIRAGQRRRLRVRRRATSPRSRSSRAGSPPSRPTRSRRRSPPAPAPPVTPEPFRPVLRGLLMTGGAPLYLRAEPQRLRARRRSRSSALGPPALAATPRRPPARRCGGPGEDRRTLPGAVPRDGPPLAAAAPSRSSTGSRYPARRCPPAEYRGRARARAAARRLRRALGRLRRRPSTRSTRPRRSRARCPPSTRPSGASGAPRLGSPTDERPRRFQTRVLATAASRHHGTRDIRLSATFWSSACCRRRSGISGAGSVGRLSRGATGAASTFAWPAA